MKPSQRANSGHPYPVTPSLRRRPIFEPGFSPGAAILTATAVLLSGGTRNILPRHGDDTAPAWRRRNRLFQDLLFQGWGWVGLGLLQAPSWLRCFWPVRCSQMKRHGGGDRERRRKDSYPTCGQCHAGWMPPGCTFGVPSLSQRPLLGDKPSRTPSIPKHSRWEPGQPQCSSTGMQQELEHLPIPPPLAWAFPSLP